jgi:hypothetical protein
MLFFLALFASYYAQEWSCEEGRGICDERVLMATRTLTAQECVKLVMDESPDANAATYMAKSKKCWAEIGHKSVRNQGESDRRYMSCSLAEIPDDVVETEAPIVEPVAPVTAPAEVLELNEPVEKPSIIAILEKIGNGGCSCKGEKYCRTGYQQFDLDLERCKAKAIELGAKAIEHGAQDHTCMTHMSEITGTNGFGGVSCYAILLPVSTYTLKKKASGGCSCKGQKYCRKGSKQWDLDLEGCKAKAIELGANALEYGAKDHVCMTHTAEITGGNGYPGVTCYDVEMELKMPALSTPALEAFAVSEGPGVAVKGLAALGMGVLLYGAGRHYLGK